MIIILREPPDGQRVVYVTVYFRQICLCYVKSIQSENFVQNSFLCFDIFE